MRLIDKIWVLAWALTLLGVSVAMAIMLFKEIKDDYETMSDKIMMAFLISAGILLTTTGSAISFGVFFNWIK